MIRIPEHWSLRGWQRRPRNAAELFRRVNVGGGHAHTFRRVIRIGPIGLYLIRYRSGWVDQ